MNNQRNKNVSQKPLLRGHFHQAMFFVSLGACALLLLKCDNQAEFIPILVYSIGLLIMFGVSALYHRITWTPSKRLIMKRLDHASIYIMIAGSFTPITKLGMNSPDGENLLSLVWVVAFIGLLQSLFFVNLPKKISAILYLIMGFLVLPYLKGLLPALGIFKLSLLLLGGLSYTIGAISYGLKKPAFIPHIFGYHEFFHVMVSIGAILHFAMIYLFL